MPKMLSVTHLQQRIFTASTLLYHYPRKELKKYILAHPTDDEAIRELVLNRRNPDATIYPPLSTLASGEAEQILRKKIKFNESEEI